VEARFLTWVSQSLGLLPNPGQVAQRLSLDDWTLDWDTYNLIQGGNLDSNVRRCYQSEVFLVSVGWKSRGFRTEGAPATLTRRSP
jgi:hypothetical protein